MRETALERGYSLDSISRQFDHQSDYEKFDFIVTMDISNYSDVTDLAPDLDAKNRVHPMVNFCIVHDVRQVPDPYYKGVDGFNLTMDIIEDGCNGLLEKLIGEESK